MVASAAVPPGGQHDPGEPPRSRVRARRLGRRRASMQERADLWRQRAAPGAALDAVALVVRERRAALGTGRAARRVRSESSPPPQSLRRPVAV